MNWSNITISQYQQCREILKLVPEDIDQQIEQRVLLASIILKKSKEEIEALGRSEWSKISEAVNSIREMPQVIKIPKYITIGWRRYRILSHVNKANVGQLLFDLRLAKTEEKMIDNMHLLVTAFIIHPWYKRIWWKITGGSPDIYRISADIKNHCPFIVAYSIALFFCKVWAELSQDTLISLIEDRIRQMQSRLKDIGTSISTDGSRQ